jgi:hypothetical protein
MKPRSKKAGVTRKGRVEVAEAHRLVQQQIGEKSLNTRDGKDGHCAPCLNKEFEWAEKSAPSRKDSKPRRD